MAVLAESAVAFTCAGHYLKTFTQIYGSAFCIFWWAGVIVQFLVFMIERDFFCSFSATAAVAKESPSFWTNKVCLPVFYLSVPPAPIPRFLKEQCAQFLVASGGKKSYRKQMNTCWFIMYSMRPSQAHQKLDCNQAGWLVEWPALQRAGDITTLILLFSDALLDHHTCLLPAVMSR